MDSRIVAKMVQMTAAGSAILLSALTVEAGGHLMRREPERPQVPAGCQPFWGYHQPCWRRFPPVPPCDNCPPELAGGFADPGISMPQSHSGIGESIPSTIAVENGAGRYPSGPAVPPSVSPGLGIPPGSFGQNGPSSIESPYPAGTPAGVPQTPSNLPALPGSLVPIPETSQPAHQSGYSPSGSRYAPGGSGQLVPYGSVSVPTPARAGQHGHGPDGVIAFQSSLTRTGVFQSQTAIGVPAPGLKTSVQSVSGPSKQSETGLFRRNSAGTSPTPSRIIATPVSTSGRYGANRPSPLPATAPHASPAPLILDGSLPRLHPASMPRPVRNTP